MPHIKVSTGSSHFPFSCQACPSKAESLLEQGQCEAALYCFRQAALEMQSADNYVSQAVCLIHLARPQEALRACDRAIAFDSNSPTAWLFRGVACHRLGRWREAYICYDLATGQSPRKQFRFPKIRVANRLGPLKALIKGAFNSQRARLRVH